VFAILLVSASVCEAQTRNWSDSTGKYSVEAELVEVRGDTVVLKRPTGAEVTVPVVRLSKIDQDFLQSLNKPGPQPPEDSPPAQPAVMPSDEKLAAGLEKGGVVSIRVSNQPVSSVLAQIEKATGNRIRVVNEFGGEDEQILAKRVSVNLQDKSFWDAVDAVTAAAGVKFRTIDDGELQLSTEGPQFDKIQVLGPSTVVGAFQVYPGFDDFFENALMVIRPEPRFGEPQVRGYHAEITLPGGKQIQYKPGSMFSPSNVHTGELTLRVDPNIPPGAEKAQQIKFEAQLAFASDLKPFTLPPLGQLRPKSVQVGEGSVCVTKVEWMGEPADRQSCAVNLRAEGLAFELKEVTLLDATGNRTTSQSGGGSKQDNVQQVQLMFPGTKISGELWQCRLAFEVPGTGEKTIGPLGDLAPKPASAGATVVRITRTGIGQQAGMDLFEVGMEFDGFPASFEQVVLVCGDNQPLKPTGWGGGGNVAQCWFDPKPLRGKEDSCRLRLQTPMKVTEHVVRATFDNIPLTKKQ
jgi:hypothetical protein